MKVKEALKIIDEGWVNKVKGYRVHLQKKVNSELITDYVPGEGEKPLDSDVVAWRLAWKLAEAAKSNGPEIADNEIVNVYVVNDTGDPIVYYGTNRFEVFNPKGL